MKKGMVLGRISKVVKVLEEAIEIVPSICFVTLLENARGKVDKDFYLQLEIWGIPENELAACVAQQLYAEKMGWTN